TPAQQQAIAALAGDIPALWAAPTTTDLDRKQLIRALVEQVTITIQGRSERVAVTITWAGGHTTHSQTVRPVARLDQLTSYPQLLRRVRELAKDGHRAHAITRRLHRRKQTPPPHRWILHADQHELAELRQRRTRPPGWYTRRRWADPTPLTRSDQGQAASSHLSVHRG